jgi:NADH-quinone oxidoreductase subunit M
MSGLNVRYLVGVDGLSLLFLPATALLFCGAIVAGWRVRAAASPLAPGLYFALLLLLEAATLGVFCALDTILFFFCWEFTLLPLYFLVSLWGLGAAARQRRYAISWSCWPVACRCCSVCWLWFSGRPREGLWFSTCRRCWRRRCPITQYRGVPAAARRLWRQGAAGALHTWLPSLAMGAPAAVTALLVGLKLGAYGLIRFAIPLAPIAARDLHWLLAGFGTVAILYGGVAALAQSNLRSVLAYASLAHVGLVLLGLAAFSVSALQGALLQLLNFSVAAGGGFLALSFLQRRTGSTDISQLGGVMRSMPVLSGFFLLFGLAGIGLPGTSGFPGELLIIVAALHSHTGAGLAVLFGMVLAAAGFLSPFRQAFLGPLRNPDVAAADDLLPREWRCCCTQPPDSGGWRLSAADPRTDPAAAEAWVAALAGL